MKDEAPHARRSLQGSNQLRLLLGLVARVLDAMAQVSDERRRRVRWQGLAAVDAVVKRMQLRLEQLKRRGAAQRQVEQIRVGQVQQRNVPHYLGQRSRYRLNH